MKTLLIKDFMLIKSQKRSIGIMALLVIIFAVFNMNPSFAISYGTVVFLIIAINTIAYDEYEKSNLYLFSLPIDRTTYATEKYLFSGMLLVGSTAIISIVTVASEFIKNQALDHQFLFEWRTGILAGVLIGVLMLAFTVPTQLKYGPEKGRLMLFGITIVVVVGTYLLDKISLQNGISVMDGLDKWMTGKLTIIQCGLGIIVCIITLEISMAISRRIMANKEY